MKQLGALKKQLFSHLHRLHYNNIHPYLVKHKKQREAIFIHITVRVKCNDLLITQIYLNRQKEEKQLITIMQVFKGFSKSNKVKKHFIEGNKLTECLKMSLV